MNSPLISNIKRLIKIGYDQNTIDEITAQISDDKLKVSRKAFLALKHGSIGAGQRILMSLSQCSCHQIFQEGALPDTYAYQDCIANIDAGVKLGFLKQTAKPIWAHENTDDINPVTYYECQKCRLVWELSAPEHGQKGGWKLAE